MTYTFPDVSSNPKGQDGTTIYGTGTSIGSNRIFHYLRQNANGFDPPKWDLYLINIYTLVRNAYSKGIEQRVLESIVDADSDLLMIYIGAYTTFRRQIPSVVFFYAPDYSAVPKDIMRVHSGNQSEMDAMYDILCKKLPPTLTELTTVPETRKFLSKVGRTILPQKELIEQIRKIYNGNRTNGMIGSVMISHCPIDFHIYKFIPTIQLLESYTGSVLSVSEFGNKLTKEVKIPFNTTTHRLFGDSLQINPLLKGKDRTKLIEVASEFKWNIKTESEITREALFKFPNLSQYELSILKL